jgi:hypothetical protein
MKKDLNIQLNEVMENYRKSMDESIKVYLETYLDTEANIETLLELLNEKGKELKIVIENKFKSNENEFTFEFGYIFNFSIIDKYKRL